jgi:hypothetical protein
MGWNQREAMIYEPIQLGREEYGGRRSRNRIL